MIELKKKGNSIDNFLIYVDGELCNNSYAYHSGSHYEIKSYEDCNKFLIYKIQDIPNFYSIFLYNLYEWIDFHHYLYFSYENEEGQRKNKSVSGSFEFSPKLENWNKDFSFFDFYEVFQDFWKKESNKGKVEFVNEEAVFITINFKVSKPSSAIKGFIAPFESSIKTTYLQTINLLNSRLKNDSFTTTFRFPEKLKVPCEQYLLYFTQFLQDLGINATRNITEEAGKVLFSVTPTDDTEALDKIREALAIYLHLPSSPIIYDDSFASMRQKQQIENLQHSQRMIEMEFRLSQKVIANQDKIILQKDLLIEQQNKIIEKILSKSIMLDSVENREELEEIYDGLKIGESKSLKEWLGIHLNPAKVIKTGVKNVFGKEETKSVLGLDKETNQENN